MNNKARQEIYLRDRTRLTPAQRRRVAKNEHNNVAQLNRAARRSGRRQVLRAERIRRLSIRAMFARRAA